MSEPDLYVFDLDGTLVDSAADIAVALNAALVDAGHAPRRPEEVQGFLGHGARELVRQAAGDAPTDPEVDALLADYRARYRRALVVHTRPYPGVEDLLSRLPAPAAVLTNKPGADARAIVAQLGLSRFVADVVGEGDGWPRKPEPVGLAALVAKHRAERPVYVGDSLIDAETAARAGVAFVFVRWGYGRAPVGVRVIDRPEQLLP